MRKTSLKFFQSSMLCKVALVAFMLAFQAMFGIGAGVLKAQSVTGTVTSGTDNEPLIGASVQVQGTKVGTVTDLDGNFKIDAKNGQMLEVSYLGFITQKVKVTAGGANLNIVLQEDKQSLEEVVVVGYGVQKKKLLTGATTQVKGDDIAKMNTTSPLQAMQGQTPGVNITTTSGQPGSGMKVTIRGLGSNEGSSPLYLIDGVGGDISTLNPADIESIDILKDAASAAIYGAQAANGVVLITTKSGKEGSAKISFDSYIGVQKVARSPKLLNAKEYKVIMDEYNLNMGTGAVNDWDSMASTQGVDTNWFDALTNDASIQSYNLSVTGGSKTSTYAMSLGYLYQEGIVGGKGISDMDRYNFRINSEHKLYKDIVTVGEHASLIYKTMNGVNDLSDGNANVMYSGSSLRSSLMAYPVNPVYGKDDYGTGYFDTNYSDWNTGTGGNPIGSMMVNKKRSQNWAADANVYMNIQPIKNLLFRTVFGVSYNNSKSRSYTSKYKFDQYTDNKSSYVSQNAGDGFTLTWTNTLSYNFDIKDHSFNALLGTEASRYDGEYMYAANQNMKQGMDSWDKAWLNNANDTKDKAQGISNDPTRTVSYFGRLGWSWKDTYMLNATLRCDGSSRFAEGHRFGWFPSVSAGWTLTNEKFMKPVTETLDFLKLRLSWGQVGNQNIATFRYLATLSNDVYYNYGSTTNSYGFYPSSFANEDLTWETSEQFNVGVDARLFKKLNVNLDYYVKTTKDWLVNSPTFATTGFSTAWINGGNVRNSGFEFNLNWNDRIGKDFMYNVGFNGAYNKNEVTEVPTDDGIIHGRGQILSDDNTEIFRAQSGHAMGFFFGYKTAGIFQNQQEIEDWISAGNGVLQPDVKPGDVRYVDMDHNGVINDDDKVDLGNGVPKFTFGFNLGFNYKNFDFNAQFAGATGFYILQSYRNYTGYQNNWTTAVLQRWTGEGTSNKVPRISSKATMNYEFSDLFLQKGDYLRLSNITLGYDFAPLVNQKWLSQCRLYVQAQNLFCLTKYDGMDPEVGYGYNSWVSGMDFGSYPRPRTFLVGLNVKF